MPIGLQILLICLFLAAYLAAVFFALPLLLLSILFKRFGNRPERIRTGIPIVRFLVPGSVTLALIFVFFGRTAESNWLDGFVQEANNGREWALVVILGVVLALSAFLGGRLNRIQKSRMEKSMGGRGVAHRG
jgi:hypothetical protein